MNPELVSCCETVFILGFKFAKVHPEVSGIDAVGEVDQQVQMRMPSSRCSLLKVRIGESAMNEV